MPTTAKRSRTQNRQTLYTGPWKGVKDSRDPWDDDPSQLVDLTNCYIPDPKGGSGAYARRGFGILNLQDPYTGKGQAVYSHVVNEDVFDFVVAGGKLLRANRGHTIFTDVTPTSGVQISPTSPRVYLTTFGEQRYGLICAGHGITATGNSVRGFKYPCFLYNANDDDVGHLSIVGNAFVNTGGAAASIGVSAYTDNKRLGPITIADNRFRDFAVVAQLNYATDLVLSGNIVSGITSTNVVATAIRMIVQGNISDGGPLGLQLTCLSGSSDARMVVSGNSMSACSAAYAITANSGLVTVSGNDFGATAGISGDNGDTSPTITLSASEVQRFSTTLTADRTVTLSGTRAYRGARIRILRDAGTPGAFTLSVVDGVGSTTISTIASGATGWTDAEFNGTNWVAVGSGTVS